MLRKIEQVTDIKTFRWGEIIRSEIFREIFQSTQTKEKFHAGNFGVIKEFSRRNNYISMEENPSKTRFRRDAQNNDCDAWSSL